MAITRKSSEASGDGKAAKSKVKAPTKVNALNETKPKGVRNAFTFFVQEKTKDTKSNAAGQLKELSEVWKKMTAAEREPYERSAQEDKERYADQLSDWKKDVLKKPPSGYQLFVAHFAKSDDASGVNKTDLIKSAAAAWRDLDADEKAAWQKKGEEKKTLYVKDKEKYSAAVDVSTRYELRSTPKRAAAVAQLTEAKPKKPRN